MGSDATHDTSFFGDRDVLGYRHESCIFKGPDGYRKIGDWTERVTTWHPETLRDSYYRQCVELVPAAKTDDVVAHYYKREVAGEIEGDIVEFEPSKLGKPVWNVTPVTTGDSLGDNLPDALHRHALTSSPP